MTSRKMQCQRRGLTKRAAHVAQEQIQQVCVSGCKRGCAGDAVRDSGVIHEQLDDKVIALIVERLDPGGHIAAEGQQQEHTSGDGRVRKVAAQTAEQLFYHSNGKDAADGSLPQGQGYRQVQRQQHAGEHSAAVCHGHFFLHEPLTDQFGEHTDNCTVYHHKQSTWSKDHSRRHDRRHKCQHHQQHDLLRGHAAAHVG